MTKNFRCDHCGEIKEVSYDEPYPKDWVIVKVFCRAQKNMKGQQGKGYHLCKKCNKEIFKKCV